MLIAPTEPMELKQLGRSSSAPEQYGVDVMFGSPMGTVGIQRKELADFFTSVTDGRLVREYPMMQQLAIAVLVIEGKQRWSTEGYYLGSARGDADYSRRTWTRDQFRGYMMSVQSKGIWVAETDSLADTRAYVEHLHRWANKPGGHHSLNARPKPTGAWGKADSREWQMFLAQSFPGIGAVQAERMIDHFGGALPIGWTCEKKELGAVPGIGKTRMDALWDALPATVANIPLEADEGDNDE